MRLNRLAERLSVESIRKLLTLKKNLRKARAMEKRHKALLRETVQLEKAIAKLRESGGTRKRRKFSAAVRRKMAVAQRRRWAKIHRQKKTPTRNRKVEATASAGTTL